MPSQSKKTKSTPVAPPSSLDHDASSTVARSGSPPRSTKKNKNRKGGHGKKNGGPIASDVGFEVAYMGGQFDD
ncbi:hypothetical protein CSHISOI_05751 [Colletotrichum shisoi]|uniref:Uncharacterized protein n=1 Tax=Colletotrichum shisoi TaxID=2078593 RepID=A0A5Q4BSK5_9PEZI|nr:hypothetical protein CSHISOI_05751 [Colletotrichum shisoi]